MSPFSHTPLSTHSSYTHTHTNKTKLVKEKANSLTWKKESTISCEYGRLFTGQSQLKPEGTKCVSVCNCVCVEMVVLACVCVVVGVGGHKQVHVCTCKCM